MGAAPYDLLLFRRLRIAKCLCNTEVCNFHHIAARHEDILRLHVGMDQLCAVGKTDARTNLDRYL